MNQKFVNKIHKAICRHYVASNGKSISQLSEWYISLTDLFALPELLAVANSSDLDTNVPNAIEELEHLGYVTEQPLGLSLTELGLKAGTMSFSQKFLNFLNGNPGITSSLALLVASISLYFSYIKL